MAQYIDKAAVVAEIEKRKNENLECAAKAGQGYFGARAMEDIDILSCLDTIEVKEVDSNPEYVHKDAFVEKVLKYLDENFYFNNLHYAVENNTFNCKEEMFEDFKKYMEDKI